MSEKFISNRLTLIVLASACTVILVSMGLRQTFGLFFEAFEEIYTNYDMFSAIIKNYVKVYNQNSSKYLNKFFLYHIEKILERELYNTKNLDSVFKEKTFKVLDLYCNLIKNKEQSKENNSTTNSKTLNV